MSFALAQARTFLDDIVRGSNGAARADEAWTSIRAKLDLSRDMASPKRRARFAKNVLRAELPRPTRYLEIGSFEGGSLAFVHSLLGGHMLATSIDPYQDCVDPKIEQRFHANMRAAGINARVLRGMSLERLPPLIADRELFDLIYIDGSHAALDVMTDAVLCWRLLTPSGLMIFDDYRDFECAPAIDAFVNLVGATVVDIASQIFLRRGQ